MSVHRFVAGGLAVCLAWAAAEAVRGQEARVAQGAAPLKRLVHEAPSDLQRLLEYTSEPLPLVSAHRGGPARGYPENCLATFEHTLRHTFALLEVDPRYTKDGAIVLHHDATLERTTTGRGRVADHTLAELKQLRLMDNEGNVTEHALPTLDEALEWARGKTVLVLDQKDVPALERAKYVTEHKAEAYAMLIVYSYRDAQAIHRLNPNIMMEVMVPSLAKVSEFDRTGVPWRNVIAFVGHDPPHAREVYEAIHERGARCLVGTSRNLDRKFLQGDVRTIEALEKDYRALLDRGADVLETDIPVPLGPLLYKDVEPPKEVKGLFSAK